MSQSKSILLIDDDEMIHTFFKLMLTKEGYNLTIAGNRQLAIGLLDEMTPDLIIIDKNLGDEDGGLLCKDIKSQSGLSDTPVLLISGYPMSNDEYRSYLADGFIGKPINMANLKQDIKNILGNTGD